MVVDGGRLDFPFVDFVKKITSRQEVIFEHSRGDDMPVDDSKMAVVAKTVEELVQWVWWKIRNGVVPFIVVFDVIVEDGRAPFLVGSENQMGKTVPFGVGAGTHGEIR